MRFSQMQLDFPFFKDSFDRLIPIVRFGACLNLLRFISKFNTSLSSLSSNSFN